MGTPSEAIRHGELLWTLSVVSHGQATLVRQLLADLERLDRSDFEVLLTVNIPEDESGLRSDRLALRLLRNPSPKGFGANHNAAFAEARTPYFVVLNPDIRTPELDLDVLRAVLDDAKVGAIAPLVYNSKGTPEDSARRFPTFGRLLRRVLTRQRRPDYAWGSEPQVVDWVAGMFIAFRSEAFQAVNGFDARRFFMYYEDVDLCRRLQRAGWPVILQPATRVIHDAQRASHRNLRHLRWHVTSALRFLTGV